jgi:hypothetical protein
MAQSMDKVPQADGTYKWEMVEITQEYLAERAAKEEALANGTAFPGTKAETKPKATRRKKSTKVEESTNS